MPFNWSAIGRPRAGAAPPGDVDHLRTYRQSSIRTASRPAYKACSTGRVLLAGPRMQLHFNCQEIVSGTSGTGPRRAARPPAATSRASPARPAAPALAPAQRPLLS
ncbi:hypothetical protein EVAR_23807_1 [Eumeta japonica]|uniref:Uncharacterized protein n=1 Tax=Eumeta variegata TaxID=151549 RepID=A0A4C1VKE2_EUMVA|nr:hypothetical protein EVAR_23807_1 [Eumeta japonica]